MTDLACTPSGQDGGDETFRRYRYQATYAAILAVGMLDGESELVEIYCELCDDILLKLKDDSFVAVQVKTRQLGDNPWKTSDQEMVSALGKFTEHERHYPGKFSKYVIATNHHFYRRPTGTSLSFISELARTTQSDKRVQKFAATCCKGTQHQIPDCISALCRLHLADELPKLGDITSGLQDVLQQRPEIANNATIPDIRRIADSLSLLTYQASSVKDPPPTHLYLSLTRPDSEIEEDRVRAKLITKANVQEAVRRHLQESAVLTGASPLDLSKLPGDMSRLEKKMTAGGLSATTVASAKDWSASALHQYRKWAAKYSEKMASERFNHVATVVQTACQEAHESTRVEEMVFGRRMLMDLQRRIKDRMRNRRVELFDCCYEHLLGYAAIKTNECKVWWSTEFDVDKGTE
jgi:hypothetical protein